MVQVKKKKTDKAAPFQKQKQKVGKKKLKPVNATSAEIHAQTIFMRKQTKEETDEAKTERNLTFTDCLAKLKHYNPAIRKEGIFGIHSLLKMTVETEKEAIPASAHATLVLAVLPLHLDPDRELRKAVVALLRVGLVLFESTGTLHTLLPLIIRYLTVGLTHMDVGVRQTACRALHYVCQATTAALPDSLMLVECCYRMLSSATRPADRSQPPVMQAYIAILRSNLLSGGNTGDWGGSDGLFGKAAAATQEGEQVVTPSTDLSSFSSTLRYLTGPVCTLVSTHWQESVQDKRSDTKVGPWELGLIEALNSIFLALAWKQGPDRLMPDRFRSLPRRFRQSLVKMAACFPFASTGNQFTQRVNAQLALLLSNFFGVPSFEADLDQGGANDSDDSDDGDTAAPTSAGKSTSTASKLAHSVLLWVQPLIKREGIIKTLLTPDIRALVVIIERLTKYGGVRLSPGNELPNVGDLLASSGGAGSPITLEVAAALHRGMQREVELRKDCGKSAEACIGMFPKILFELAQKLEQKAESSRSSAAQSASAHSKQLEDLTLPCLVPTVDGAAVSTPYSGANALSATAYFLLDTVALYSNTGASLSPTLLNDLRLALFGFACPAGGLCEATPGLVAQLPPQLAHAAVSLIPALCPPEAGPEVPCGVLALLIRCLNLAPLVAAEVVGDELEGAERVNNPLADRLLAYALELLRDQDVGDAHEELYAISGCVEQLPAASAAAALVLSDYSEE